MSGIKNCEKPQTGSNDPYVSGTKTVEILCAMRNDL